MKIIEVKTQELHKYISTKIEFNHELSIITGVNGSGKTSILSLIESVLKLDINKINDTSFKTFELLINVENKQYKILIEKSEPEPEASLDFYVNNFKISVKNTGKKNIFGNRKSNIVNEFIEKYNMEVTSDNSDFNIFSSIKAPMLIGLNRRISNRKSDCLTKGDLFDSYDIKLFDDNNEREIDSFDVALNDCKRLVNNEFKRIKKYENVQLNTLRNNIITSSFTYIDNYDGIIDSQSMIESRFLEVKERKNEIIDVLNNIEIKGHELSLMSSSFFEKLDGLYDKAFTKNKDREEIKFTLEYLLNITQVERIYNLVKIIDKHKSNLDDKRKKIDLFEKVVNSFFAETDKKIVINSIGNIYVSINNSSHKVEIDELSSGEKQLVIIIANMVFSRKNDISNIIIDEPEISLHIKWQDMFITALREINSDIQLILATHSPDIIGEYDDYCTPIEAWSL